jgi:chemotaxis protein CheZ
MTSQPKVADRPYSRKEVVQILQSAMASVGSETEATKKLQQELQVLHDYIENMRSELAQMRSIEISHNHIPSATDELDAVVGETAKATGTIMDACEKIETIGGKIGGDQGNELSAIVTSIYEACGFQDITGQRITKVVKTIKNIENKVGDILSAFGHAIPGKESGPAAPSLQEKASLLNGPQLKGPSVNQDEIDKLLAEFDTK